MSAGYSGAMDFTGTGRSSMSEPAAVVRDGNNTKAPQTSARERKEDFMEKKSARVSEADAPFNGGCSEF
jgi:hypothetical protein